MDVSRAVTEGYKIWICAGGVLLVLAWVYLPRKRALNLLQLLMVIAGFNYMRLGPDAFFGNRVDVYDVAHYYLNAKYFGELGYYDLYPAMMLADHENGGPKFDEGNKYMAQDENGHTMQPIAHGIQRGYYVRDRQFTPERWQQFTHDMLHIQRGLHGFSDKLWRQMLQDHGFNGTPAWVMIARPLALVVPVEYVKILCWADFFLLAGALWATRWAYGGVAAWWVALFLAVSYSTRWPTITWSYFRYDWVAALIIAMAMLRKGKHLGAGVVTGFAAASRMFPAVWMYGPAMKGLFNLPRHVHKQLLVMAGGFLLGVGALYGGSMVIYGPEPAVTHFQNMMDHNKSDQLSSRRIGLALGLAFDGRVDPKFIPQSRKDLVEKQRPMRFAIAFVVMMLMGWSLARRRDDEAFAFGFLPFFLLTTASYYYYVARITLVVLHASDLSKVRNRVGLSLLLGIELFSNWAETYYPGQRVFLIGWLSWGLTLYVLLMTAWFLWERKLGLNQEPLPAQAPTPGTA